MPLSVGTRLGAYVIDAAIGAGGMGEVYRATDTNLKRAVAIKVLPEILANDLDRLARFQREAEVLATLNHPHIAQIYGLERLRQPRAEDEQIRGEGSASARAGGGAPAPLKEVGSPTIALVMELVDGPTLADRIAHGPIPLDEALAIARQIADALEAAHERGIVHRDLKPANIKLRPDGTVKVLDFGLAKAGEAGEAGGAGRAGGNFSMSPTLTSPAMTQAGIILGTAAYMAPEQARGKVVDKRADIFAFGCVLYEMLTGRRAFEGEDITDTLARVVRDTTDLTAVPVKVRRLLAKCLEKDPKKRLRDIGDAWELLDDDAAPAAAAAAPRVRGLPWAVAALAVVATVGVGVVHFSETADSEPSLQLSIPVPDADSVGFLDLSPDGKRVALSIFREGTLQLHVRSLESGDLQPLAGTATARNPFWSPDSRFIGFFADGKLKVVPAAGGPAQVLCADTGSGSGGTWSRNGVILFSSDNSQLRRVDAGGGDCKAVSQRDQGFTATMPVFLPDGDHFFYAGGRRKDPASVYLATLEEPIGRKVLADQSSVVYAPPVRAGERAHLLFLRENRLMAQPFDEARLEVVGDPFAVADRGSFAWTTPQVAAAASADGTLVYLAGRSTDAQLTWVDRTGKTLGTVGPRGQQSSVALSPDGNGVLIKRHPSGDLPALWIQDLVRGSDSRLTPAGSTAGQGIWAPDSRRIAFGLTAADASGWYLRDLGSAEPALLRKAETGVTRVLSDWSRDGRFLVYTQSDPKSRADIWYVPFDSGSINEQGAVKLLGTEAIESQGQLSPDGKWLAYVSNETGTHHVYVRPFPAGSSAWKVSVDSGQEPRWGRDGKELFFLSNIRNVSGTPLMATAVEPDGHGGLRFGVPHELFETRGVTYLAQSNSFFLSPHPDGQRFLMNAGVEEGETTINVITHWQRSVSAPSGASR